MIRAFGNIRKGLLEKSNLTSYLLYGLGEIALVVIGILIALQIDNANEARKEEIVRQEYYHQILKDLEKDKTYLLSELDKVNGNLKLHDEYISHVNDDSDPKEVLFLQTKLNPYFSYLAFNTNAIETLQSTGDIKLMPTQIRNQLIDYRNTQDFLCEAYSG